jgi:hypothetical protein
MMETQNPVPVQETPNVKDLIFQKKEELTEVKSAFRKFKKAHGIRTEEGIKEPKVRAEYEEWATKVAILQEELDGLNAQAPAKGTRGAGTSYKYGQFNDPTTGEPRDATSKEMKRWRAHARKKAKALGIESSRAVEWDPNFLIKPAKVEKVKAEKPEKVAKVKAEGTEEAATAVPKKKKVKPAAEAQEID